MINHLKFYLFFIIIIYTKIRTRELLCTTDLAKVQTLYIYKIKVFINIKIKILFLQIFTYCCHILNTSIIVKNLSL